MRNPRYRHLIIALALIMPGANASAEWRKSGSNKEAVFYIDPDTLTQNAGVTSIQVMKDFYQVQIGPSREKFKSAKIYFEFDCIKKIARQAYLTRHSGAMGGGGGLSSDLRIYPWSPLDPESEEGRVFAFTCKQTGSNAQALE